jgi:hypothetical protein
VRGVAQAGVEALQSLLESTAADNLGMAMLFTLSTSAREWLREKANIEAPLDEAAQAAERARLEYEEEARREAERAAGTPVTPESYAEWWARFSAETAGSGADAAGSAPAAGDKPKRLTGRRYFETRGEAAAAAEDEAEGEVPPEEEEDSEEGSNDDEDEDEEDDDEWDPDALGCVAARVRVRL